MRGRPAFAFFVKLGTARSDIYSLDRSMLITWSEVITPVNLLCSSIWQIRHGIEWGSSCTFGGNQAQRGRWLGYYQPET
jgi:hypothetical protein